MRRAIKTAISALGVVGATAVTAPPPASAQLFWPAFSIVPYYNYYYDPTYQPAFWGGYGYGYRPLWRRYHHYGYYRSRSWGRGRRRHYGFYRYRHSSARFGGYRHIGFGGHRWYGRAGFGRRGFGAHGAGGIHR